MTMLLQSRNGEESRTRGGAGAEAAASELCPVYPMELAEGAMSEDLGILYQRWSRRQGWPRSLTEGEPWVPVGCSGPVLILGHHRPAEAPLPLPAWCFQPVRLSLEDYLGRLQELQLWLREDLVQETGTTDAGLLPFPERFIRPVGVTAALHFLLEYFPHRAEDERLLRSCLSSQGTALGRLPEGYAAALDLVLRRACLVDLRSVKVPTDVVLPTAFVLPGEASLISVHGRRLWVAAPRHLAVGLEDGLLNELGEGWQVRVLQPAHSGGSVSADSRETSCEAGGRRGRLVIESRTQLARGQEGLGFTPGEIVISERLAEELEHYDPRRPGRDPAKVFLRELSAAIRCGASDLHIEPGVETARVRVRVDGVMEEWLEMGADFGQSVVGAAKELVGLPAERFLPQDGSCTIQHCGAVVGARVSSYPIRRRRQKLVLRLLPRRGRVPALAGLLPAWQARLLLRAARSPQGLILVCGPTGSGKTTTLFSVLSELNSPARNIMTMEDPVEYELEGLNQAELDTPRGVTWDALLRGFLRQDPDAGLIGEVRDRETAETAVRQALTGHVVFATLHTLSCARTLERLIDMGVNPDMLASALTLVEGQRLVRRLCMSCRVARAPSRTEEEVFANHGVPTPRQLWCASALGCPHCRHGYQGRVAAVEVLPVVEEVVTLIEQRARSRAFEEWMARNGLPNVFQAALQLVAEGATSLEEALEWQSVWGDFNWRPRS